MPTYDPDKNLRDALAEIEHDFPPVSSNPDRDRAAAEDMPLCHSTFKDTFQKILASRQIMSASTLYPGDVFPPDHSQAILGTTDFVFTYVGGFKRAETQVGFLFDAPRGETSESEVTPFDSGCLKRLYPSLTDEELRNKLQNSILPVPGYRAYFAEFLCRCFESPDKYLDGEATTSARLPGVSLQTQWESWTFELRIRDRVHIENFGLRALFSDIVTLEPFTDYLDELTQSGVDIVTIPRDGSSGDLLTASSEYIRQHLDLS